MIALGHARFSGIGHLQLDVQSQGGVQGQDIFQLAALDALDPVIMQGIAFRRQQGRHGIGAELHGHPGRVPGAVAFPIGLELDAFPLPGLLLRGHHLEADLLVNGFGIRPGESRFQDIGSGFRGA